MMGASSRDETLDLVGAQFAVKRSRSHTMQRPTQWTCTQISESDEGTSVSCDSLSPSAFIAHAAVLPPSYSPLYSQQSHGNHPSWIQNTDPACFID